MSQEELAARLHVVRQTISKWEKGLSVPDSALLIRLAEVFEVPVSELLGERIEAEEQPNALAEQLARINEQLAIRNPARKTNLEGVGVDRGRHCCGDSFGHTVVGCIILIAVPLRRDGQAADSLSRSWGRKISGSAVPVPA